MSDDDLTPKQGDAVSALLASARHTDPTPPAVVARLDAALDSLTAERREVRTPVVTLASRRRRTTATALLAAAAVVVVGVSITQALPDLTTPSDESAGSAAEAPASAEDRADGRGATEFGDQSELSTSADEKKGQADQETLPLPSASSLREGADLNSDTPLRRQVRALRSAAHFTASYDAGATCLVDTQSGQSLAVTYNGQPGVLVFRMPLGETQLVDLFLCGRSDAVRSLTLSAP